MTALTKPHARETVQRSLDAVTDEEYRRSSEVVVSRIRDLLKELQGQGKLRSVLSYHPQPKWKEVDLAPLEQEFTGVRFDYVSLNLNAAFPEEAYDVILVPLYSFNSEGYRLGHGGGWYDRFLITQLNAHKIGVGLSVCQIDFTHEPHDIPMDTVVTEQGHEILRRKIDRLRPRRK